MPERWKEFWPVSFSDFCVVGRLCWHDVAVVGLVCKSWRSAVRGLQSRELDALECQWNNPVECALDCGSRSRLDMWVRFGWDLSRFPGALDMAADRGSAACVEFLLSQHWAGFSVTSETWAAAAGSGSIGVLKVVKRVCPEAANAKATARAAGAGHLNALQWLVLGGFPWDASTCKAAASGGSLTCLKFAVERGCTLRMSAAHQAAAGGHVQCLRWLVEKAKCPYDPYVLAEHAASSGNVKCLEYCCKDLACSVTEDLAISAARSGSVECLRLAQKGIGWRTLDEAVEGGNIECLAYCLGQGCKCRQSTILAVLEMDWAIALKWLHEDAQVECWDGSTMCDLAASCRAVKCLGYCHECGCPMGSDVCVSAIRAGSLECLEFAVDHGAPKDQKTVEAALCRGSLSVLKFCHSAGFEFPQNVCRQAVRCGCESCLEYLISLGYPLTIDRELLESSVHFSYEYLYKLVGQPLLPRTPRFN